MLCITTAYFFIRTPIPEWFKGIYRMALFLNGFDYISSFNDSPSINLPLEDVIFIF